MSPPLDLQALTSAVYGVLASDAAGADVRALLSGSPPAIVHAEQLRHGVPTTPFVALRGEGVGGSSRDMRSVSWRWWVYDDPQQYYWRINAIVSAIGAAYAPPAVRIAGGRTELASIGPETLDDELGLIARSLQIVHYRRG